MDLPGKYGLKRLVWYELHERVIAAIKREKSLEKYDRDWKINLIERDNPHWNDVSMTLAFCGGVHGWPGQQQPGHDGLACSPLRLDRTFPRGRGNAFPESVRH
jgi:hypothetical protein